MSVLRYLSVELSLQVESFNNNIRGASKELKEFEKNIKPTTELLKDTGETFKDVGKAAAGFGLAILGAMGLAVKSTADYGDELNDLSKKTGVAVEELSKLKLAADTSGTDMEGLSTGLKFLAKNMELAIGGSVKQQQAFEAVGISTKDLVAANGNVSVILSKVAAAFKNTDDDAAKTTVSLALFGKQGANLIPLLDEGADGLKKWGDEAERTGRVISKEAAQAADEFNDRVTVLKSSVAGLGGAIGTALLPAMKDLVEEATSVVIKLREWTSEHPELTKGVAATALAITGVGGLAFAVGSVIILIPSLVKGLRELDILLKALEADSLAAAAPILGVGAAFAAVAGVAIYFRKELGTGLLMVLELVLTAFENTAKSASSLASALGLSGLSKALQSASNSIGGFRKQITDNLDALGEMAIDKVPMTSKQLEILKKKQDEAAEASKKHKDHIVLQGEATNELQNAIKGLLDQFDGEIKRGPALTGVLEILLNRHAPIQEIVAKLGKQTHEYVQALEAEGKAINPVLRYVDDMYVKTKQLNEEDAKQFDFAVLLGKTWEQNAVNLQAWLQAGADSSAKLKLINDNYEETLKKTLALENEAYKTIYGDDLKAKIDSIDEKLAADENYRDYARDVALALLETQKQADAALTAYHDIQVELRLARDRDAKQEEIDILIQQGKDALQVYDVYTKEHDKIQKESTKRNAEENKKAVEDVKRSAGKIFDDMFLSGQNVFKSLKNALKGGALSIGRSIFEDVVGELGGPIKRAFDDFFQGLLEGSGFKAFLKGLGDRIGGTIGGALGGNSGVIMNATGVGPIGPRGSSVPTTPPTTGGGTSGGPAGGIGGAFGAINVVSGIAGAIGSIGSFVEGRRMEGTLNAIEYNTRASMIHLYFILTDTTAHIRDTMFEIKDLAVEIAGDLGEILDGVNKTFNLLAARPGLAAPALAGSGPAPVFNLYISAPLNQAEINQSFTEEVDRRTVRDEISPELLDFWNTGGDNALQKLIAMLKAAWNGSVSSRV